MPIRARIALFGAGVVALTILLFGLLVYVLVSVGSSRQLDETLALRGQQAVTLLTFAPPADLAAGRAAVPIDLKTSSDTFIEVMDSAGKVTYSSGQYDGVSPQVPAAVTASAAARKFALTTLRPVKGLTLRVYVQPFSRSGGGTSGFAVAGQSTRERERQVRGLKTFLIVSGLFTLGGALLASWLVAGRALRPLHTMARTADEIGGTEDLSRRLPEVRNRDEVGRLAASFNAMLRRLEDAHGRVQQAYQRLAAALDAQKRFVADASHELRTPLTTIRNNAGFLLQHPDGAPTDRQAALQDIADESERMSRLVHDLLTLARADAGYHLEKTELDLVPIVRDVARQAQRLHPDRSVQVDEAASVPVSGNVDALKQLVWILVDNAAKHTSAGGHIRLGIGREDRAACLAVSDDGPGIPPEELPRIFERFYQADAARAGGGAGLGLAIAQWIASEHGGRVQATNNAGRGATFIVELSTAPVGHGG